MIKTCGFLQDSNGNWSSKRLVGILLTFVLIILLSITFYQALTHKLGDAAMIKDILVILATLCGSLLNVNILADIFGKK